MKQSFSFYNNVPEFINEAANRLFKAAINRPTRNKSQKSKSPYQGKGEEQDPTYRMAKDAQTKRDLQLAAQLYAIAASEGEKIDSCIKDFAGIIHQMGYATFAHQFLQRVQPYINKGKDKYKNLKQDLQKQKQQPSIRYNCNSILLELPRRQQYSYGFLNSLFKDRSRIQQVTVLNSLDFTLPSQERGKYFLLNFQSHSAAIKTIKKFNHQEQFGINKYWVKENLIVCQAFGTRQDFDIEKNCIVSAPMIKDNLQRFWRKSEIESWSQSNEGKFYNECAKMLIEEYLARNAPTEAQINKSRT